ncbi:MAG: hypothetical protein QNJ47_17360 [Nostocaceae cyanobacterium]|nr:hypothetical protein [Nostocaceae cyanobacterium]
MKRITLLTLSISFLVTLPAMAQLGNVWTDFQSYAVDLQNYLQNNVSTTLQPLELETLTAIDDATGELNIPNPIVSGQRVTEDITINLLSEAFENNSAVRSRLVNNEMNRFITRSAVEGLFGENGQIRTKIKLESTEQTVENIARFAAESDNIFDQIFDFVGGLSNPNPQAQLSSNQANLQLQSIKIQTEQSKMLAENMFQTMQVNNSLQYSNLNLANISQQLEEENRARRVDASAETARLLRNVSQIDLLGRER